MNAKSLRIIKVAISSCLITLLVVSCSHQGPRGNYFAYDLPATLPQNPDNVRVKVSTSKQMVYVLEGDKPLLVTPVSVGKASAPTPKGNFRVQKKDHYHRANSHGFAYKGNQSRRSYLSTKPSGWSFKGTPMPYWVGFHKGDTYGFHTGWIKDQPCTLGCIRMHENISPKFFRLVKVGTPINIATTQPEDATLGRNVPRPPDAGPLPDYPNDFYLGNDYFTRHLTPKFNR